jgi:hypothetical protein
MTLTANDIEEVTGGALVRANAVRKKLGVSKDTLEALAVAGKLRRMKFYPNGHWWYYAKEVEVMAR